MSAEQHLTDPLYGAVVVGEPFASVILHPALQKERKRLQSIRSLGLMFHFFPSGSHSKWEHYLGMHHVATQIREGLKAEDRETLQWLCMLGGIGSLPLTHATSSAVLLAAQLSEDFMNGLIKLVAPALALCSRCNKKAFCETPLSCIREARGKRVLRCVFSAYKIASLPPEIHIGHRDSLIRGCICQDDLLYRLYRDVSRYDYMQRDLYHTGVAKFSVGIGEAFESLTDGIDALEASQHMKLMTQMYDYLIETLYLHPNQAVSQLSP